MDRFLLSQKEKIWIVLAVLILGFIGLAVYTSNSLKEMDYEYRLSIDVTNGSNEIEQTQVNLLKLANGLSAMNSQKVESVKSSIYAIQDKGQENKEYLRSVGMENRANELVTLIGGYRDALEPWLSLRSELGFNADDGKLGRLKEIAVVIEQKIAETGMVTLNSDFQAMIKAQQNYLLTPSEQNLKLFNRAKAGFANMSNTYAMLDLYEKELEEFSTTFEKVAVLSGQLSDIESQLYANQDAVLAVVAQITSELTIISERYQRIAADTADVSLWSILIACTILAFITIVIFITLSLSITRTLNQTNSALNLISKGNLKIRVPVTNNHKDEFNQLSLAINQTCENLAELVREVQSNSDALSLNAEELNQGIDRVVYGQSEAVEQTQILASATEEVSVTTQEVSNSLELVLAVSKSSAQSAEDGGNIITLAIESIEEVGTILTHAATHIQQLEEASNKIDSVMDIINGIAEQTNLLALNAAIEAARAGEQGRGFAVVADEVRNLAVRTVEAVAEISDTIETLKTESGEVIQYIGRSEKSMDVGRQKGNDAVQALSDITEKAEEASKQTDMIFSSIRELATTSQSMADSMSQISTSMSSIADSNDELKKTSQLVDKRSTTLHEKCLKFTL
ncbi:methyl-accepting chemotaxis protein [Vibrio algarum]|uniref:Methyl-accepting chemotaxis protein n=1 Tax=Vibrio algarum TaxID=3020714 RepID=A0ABT4YPU1_9VIBR|nr:methyl-accepting chemotaxis protein [Vibrio sp. KJ40-1]MDB1123581.1 methyl-accepting chemotaxis protein [Vibrio sp. KJ40-1]